MPLFGIGDGYIVFGQNKRLYLFPVKKNLARGWIMQGSSKWYTQFDQITQKIFRIYRILFKLDRQPILTRTKRSFLPPATHKTKQKNCTSTAVLESMVRITWALFRSPIWSLRLEAVDAVLYLSLSTENLQTPVHRKARNRDPSG